MTEQHPDYDYDWLCPHHYKGCDECWGDGWLEDWGEEIEDAREKV